MAFGNRRERERVEAFNPFSDTVPVRRRRGVAQAAPAEVFGQAAAPAAEKKRKPYAIPTNWDAPMRWAESYADPVYDRAEVEAAKQLGLGPEYIDAVKRLRTMGERTNNGRVSEKGAKTPYQFIPSTRQGMITNYGVDPWADPVSGAKAAMLHLKESTDRGSSLPEAMIEYHGGSNRANWGPRTRDYASRVLGPSGPSQIGMPPAVSTPFDPKYYNQALGEMDKAEGQMLTPFHADLAQPAPPAFPDAPEFPERDFSSTDAALQNLKPVLMLERDQKRIQRANLFQGLSKGLASIPEGAGLGQVLGQIGAGMLAGKAAGDAAVQARIDAFDEKMAEWNMLNFQYDERKADKLYADAVGEVKTLYAYNLDKLGYEIDLFNKNNSVNVSPDGSHMIVRSSSDQGVAVDIVPVAPVIKAKIGMEKAGLIGGAMAGSHNAAVQANGAMERQIAAGIMMNEYATANAPSKKNGEGIIYDTVWQSHELISSGLGPQVLGQEYYQEGMLEAQRQAEDEGYMPGSEEYQERVGTIASSRIAAEVMRNPAMRERLKTVAPELYHGYLIRQHRSRQTIRKTDSKGRTTETERTGY